MALTSGSSADEWWAWLVLVVITFVVVGFQRVRDGVEGDC